MNIYTQVREVAEKYLQRVKSSGPEDIMAICPFHRKADGTPERKGSFAMSTVTGLWFCHSCHERGNLRTFLRNVGASPLLIDTFYKPLLEAIDDHSWKNRKKNRIFVVNFKEEPLPESTLGLFDYCPTGLLEDGFVEDTLRYFDVGFDQKNNRITYPLRDLLGRLVGLSGRATDDHPAKYKVYSKEEYEAWGITPRSTDKSNLIWNIDKVYPELYFTKKPEFVIVEGFKSVMWLWQAGYRDTVALMGSYLSPNQKMILERIGGTVYLFFDNDPSGHKAYHFVSKTLAASLCVRIVRYEGHQPTDLSTAELHNAMNNAVDYHRWILQGA
jgi:DNA primase